MKRKPRTPQTCGTCKFFRESVPMGECHLNGPLSVVQPSYGDSKWVQAGWPSVSTANWCGAYKRRVS